MSGNSHQVVNAREARASLDAIVEQVSQYDERVVITGSNPATRAVLISQAELEGLEKALEILSGTRDAKAMRAQVLRISTAAASMPLVSSSALS